MQGVTLTIAAALSALMVVLKPHYALTVYIAALLWYPSYLVVSVSTIDISLGRVLAALLLFRCLWQGSIRRRLTWSCLDTFVTLSMVVYVGVFLLTLPLSEYLENRAGFLMDTWFAYLIARFCITDRLKLISVLKCVSIALVPLAILGIIESSTGWQPFFYLKRFCPWIGETFKIYEPRWGFTRAAGPFTHSILFGGVFAIFLPVVYYLRYEKGWRIWAYVLSVFALLGALSSMSSGPWVMVILVLVCFCSEKRTYLVKTILLCALLSCIFVGIASNRPFYHVIVSYMNLLGGAGWHRARLIDLAIEHFGEWWLIGYGDKDPGWGQFLGMSHTDVVNEYILAGVRYGLFGIIVLCAMLVAAYRALISAYKSATDQKVKALYWSFGSVLFSVTVSWMSVAFFGQLLSLFYCVLGMMASSFNFIPHTAGYVRRSISVAKSQHAIP